MLELDLPWVPINRPKLSKIESVGKYIRRMDENHVYTNGGPLVKELEHRIAELLHISIDCVVSCSSATLAIEGAISSLGGVSHNVPDYTFAATGLAALNSKTQVKLVDIDFETLTLKSSTSASKSTDNPVPIFVAPFGVEIDAKVFDTHTTGIIDAAASLGQTIQKPLRIPAGWVAVFSLHATKVLGAGEGGIVVFGDERHAEEFRAFINFGYKEGRIGTIVGTNAKMPEVTAAYGLSAIDQISTEVYEWHLAQSIARSHLHSLDVEMFHSDEDVFQPYLIVRLKDESQSERVSQEFQRNHIQTRRWWSEPLHKMPAFQEIVGDGVNDYPNSDLASKTVLGLPMFRGLSEQQAIRIAEALERAL
jgi:dTDP-4-amino-4,6-dideoxygalactose transaminase